MFSVERNPSNMMEKNQPEVLEKIEFEQREKFLKLSFLSDSAYKNSDP